ncbi:hypothetical protein B0A65_02540 [Flavobacterium frigidimaris]|uniref:Uncharacterized protein n=1 Tax=Flavobacterium frigidimaris TaxID=262320 RepID=A0ABX4BVZ7_FLAFR|nr:hypothetical protein B0A65_02540 [Flavobacterium frigidimaris]
MFNIVGLSIHNKDIAYIHQKEINQETAVLKLVKHEKFSTSFSYINYSILLWTRQSRQKTRICNRNKQ